MDTKHKRTIDPEEMARTLDPARVKRDHDAVMEALQRPTPPTFYRGAKPRVEAPGPRVAAGEAADVDEAALPSALVPAAEERPVTKAAAPVVRGWPRAWKLIGATALVAAAMPPLVLLAGRSNVPREKAAASASAAPPVTPSAVATVVGMVMSSATATASAAASATPTPAATPTAPVKLRGRASAAHEDAGAPPPPAPTADPAATATTPPKPPTEDNPVF